MLSHVQKTAIQRAITCINADQDRLAKLNNGVLDAEDEEATEAAIHLLLAALNEDNPDPRKEKRESA